MYIANICEEAASDAGAGVVLDTLDAQKKLGLRVYNTHVRPGPDHDQEVIFHDQEITFITTSKEIHLEFGLYGSTALWYLYLFLWSAFSRAGEKTILLRKEQNGPGMMVTDSGETNGVHVFVFSPVRS